MSPPRESESDVICRTVYWIIIICKRSQIITTATKCESPPFSLCLCVCVCEGVSASFFRSVLFCLFICFRCCWKCIDPFVTSNNLTPANFNVTHIHYDCYCLPWPSWFILCEVVCKAYWVWAFRFVSFLLHFPITPSVDGSIGCVSRRVQIYYTIQWSGCKWLYECKRRRRKLNVNFLKDAIACDADIICMPCRPLYVRTKRRSEEKTLSASQKFKQIISDLMTAQMHRTCIGSR